MEFLRIHLIFVAKSNLLFFLFFLWWSERIFVTLQRKVYLPIISITHYILLYSNIIIFKKLKKLTTMKKILLSLFAAVASVVAMAGEYSVTFSELGYENAEDVTEVQIGNVTLTLDKGTNSNSPKYYTTGTALRVYGSNTMTFSSSENIVSIEFTVVKNYGLAGLAATEGQFSSDSLSWAGNTNSVTISQTRTKGHARILSIKVVTTNSGENYVPAPRFSVESGTYYSPQTVNITCPDSTCTIYYWIGDTEEQPYENPIQLDEFGTYVIYAYAHGATGGKSDLVSTTITYAEASTYNTLADLKGACNALSADEAPTVTFACETYELLVTYASGQYTFVTDGQDAFLFFGSQTALKTGDKFTGSISGKLYFYNGLRELAISDINVTVNSSDNEVEAIPFSYDDIVYDKDESKLFFMEGVQIADSALNNRALAAVDEEGNDITLYDRFDVLKNFKFNTEDSYDVTAILVQYNNDWQFYVTSIVDPNAAPPVPVDTIHIANTADQPYGVREARAILDRCDDEDIYVDLTDSVYVKGIISKIAKFNAETGNVNLYFKDNLEDSLDIEAYHNRYLGNVPYTAEDQVKVGDTIVVKGCLAMYNDTYELAEGNYLVALNSFEAQEDTTQSDTTIVIPDPYIAVGDGSKENPYTIDDVIGLYNINFAQLGDSSIVNVDTVWVRGHILGVVNTNNGDTKPEVGPNDNTNLSLGEVTHDSHISVQLPAEKAAPGVRAGLNLVDNPDNLGKEVLLQGIITLYCRVPGLKPCLGYEFVGVEPEVITVGDITDLIDKYLEGDGQITVADITDLIDRYLNQTNE